jgi:predicted Zn-dependent protease
MSSEFGSAIRAIVRSVILLLVVLTTALVGYGQTASPTPAPSPVAFPEWTPPVARDKAKTIFAPKPTKGNNIFAGEGEKWLADAVSHWSGTNLDPIPDKEVGDYVSKLGAYLATYSAAPNRPYKFVVINDDEENAFSIGNARIYINIGLLRMVESEDQLAAVIGHEIGHDAFGHSPKTITRQLFWMTGITKVSSEAEVKSALEKLLTAYEKNFTAAIGESLLGWSRSDELQADKAGFYNVYKAGYNPEAMKNVFRHWVVEEKKSGDYTTEYLLTLLFGSHPPSTQRVTALKWESNWIKMPPEKDQAKSPAFDAMKARVAKH